MDNDRLTVAHDPALMRQATFRVIDRTQDRPEMQVLATAIALYSMCDALNIDIKQLLVSVERMTNDLDGPFVSTFAALREYAIKEIGR